MLFRIDQNSVTLPLRRHPAARALTLVAATLGGVVGSQACTPGPADLSDLLDDECRYRLDGYCDEEENGLCREGTDVSDCYSGPYGACHYLTFGVVGLPSEDGCGSNKTPICWLDSPVPESSFCTNECEDDSDCPRRGRYETGCREINFLEILANEIDPSWTTRNACVIECADNNDDCPNGMFCDGWFCVWR